MFLGKDFDMDFLQKYLRGVLERPLPRNALKRTKNSKKKSRKKSAGGRVGLGLERAWESVGFCLFFAPRHGSARRGLGPSAVR
jgi:hypothetical protein